MTQDWRTMVCEDDHGYRTLLTFDRNAVESMHDFDGRAFIAMRSGDHFIWTDGSVTKFRERFMSEAS